MNAAVIEQGAYTQSSPSGRIRSPLTIREVLTPAFYYRREALLAFLIPVLLAIVAVFLAQPVYVAQSRLLILLGDDYVFRTDVSGAAGLSFDRAQIVHAEMEILTAKDLRTRAIQDVGLAKVYPALAAERLKLIVQNRRYLLLHEKGAEPNLASAALAAACRALPAQWQERFGYRPLLAESFTDPESYCGTCYKAGGWQPVGMSDGNSRHRADFFIPNGRPKRLWMKELEPHARRTAWGTWAEVER